MNTDRQHRMTEVFGRLAPGATIEAARAELRHDPRRRSKSRIQGSLRRRRRASAIAAVQLRDQITSNARPVMLALLASAALVFIGACANVANLMLARATRRRPELAMRAALGASTGALRRLLLIESVGARGRPARSPDSCSRFRPSACWPAMPLASRFARRRSPRRTDAVRGSTCALDPAAAIAVRLHSAAARRPTTTRRGAGVGANDRARARRPAHLCRRPDRRVVRAAGRRGTAVAGACWRCRRPFPVSR